MKMNANKKEDSKVEVPTTKDYLHRLSTRSSNNRKEVQFKANFEIIEMPAHMQLDAVSFVTEALEQFNGDYDESADYLCHILDQKYPEPTPWACMLGTNFGYSVEPSAGKYMLFYIGNVNRIRVMAFASKTSH